jgi:hypothetical protein
LVPPPRAGAAGHGRPSPSSSEQSPTATSRRAIDFHPRAPQLRSTPRGGRWRRLAGASTPSPSAGGCLDGREKQFWRRSRWPRS